MNELKISVSMFVSWLLFLSRLTHTERDRDREKKAEIGLQCKKTPSRSKSNEEVHVYFIGVNIRRHHKIN